MNIIQTLMHKRIFRLRTSRFANEAWRSLLEPFTSPVMKSNLHNRRHYYCFKCSACLLFSRIVRLEPCIIARSSSTQKTTSQFVDRLNWRFDNDIIGTKLFLTTDVIVFEMIGMYGLASPMNDLILSEVYCREWGSKSNVHGQYNRARLVSWFNSVYGLVLLEL